MIEAVEVCKKMKNLGVNCVFKKELNYEDLILIIKNDLLDEDKFEVTINYIRKMTNNYSKTLGLNETKILRSMEKKRTYWSANYYQELNFPLLDNTVKLFNTKKEVLNAMKSKKFVCPSCEKVQSSPYSCRSKFKVDGKKVCNWKSYGLLGTLGKGFRFTIIESFIENPLIDDCFMPLEFQDTQYDPKGK